MEATGVEMRVASIVPPCVWNSFSAWRFPFHIWKPWYQLNPPGSDWACFWLPVARGSISGWDLRVHIVILCRCIFQSMSGHWQKKHAVDWIDGWADAAVLFLFLHSDVLIKPQKADSGSSSLLSRACVHRFLLTVQGRSYLAYTDKLAVNLILQLQ